MTRIKTNISLNIFPKVDGSKIWIIDSGLEIRNNCQKGQFTNSEKTSLGNELECTFLQVRNLFGRVSEDSDDTLWKEIYFVPNHTVEWLPKNCVCYTLVKTRSLTNLSNTVSQIISLPDVDPSNGIFRLSFIQHSSPKGDYYSLKFDWRERQNKAEDVQLINIYDFMDTEPKLTNRLSLELIDLDTLSMEEQSRIIQEAKSRRFQEKIEA